ncbi:hypothetical protein, partial [Lonsdalea britannica]|uniref:hypothetical protein n=1 Tax=Lonsdalea britannica TaxID=1082704 RepID=UPI0026F28DB8
HQHISTSAHQHISTSAHQHISTSAHQPLFVGNLPVFYFIATFSSAKLLLTAILTDAGPQPI